MEQNRKGFTLIELIISMTIFTFFIAIGVASYVNLSVTLKNENVMRKLYSEMENVLSDIQRWGKFYQIDYDWYKDTTEPLSVMDGNTELVLISQDGQSRIRLKKTHDTMLGIYRELKQNGEFKPQEGFQDGEFQSLTSTDLHMDDVRFFLFPGTKDAPFQEKITITLSGYMTSPYKEGKERFSMQTSFSSRLYGKTY